MSADDLDGQDPAVDKSAAEAAAEQSLSALEDEITPESPAESPADSPAETSGDSTIDPEAVIEPESAPEIDDEAVDARAAPTHIELDTSIPSAEYDLFGAITEGIAPSDDESLETP